MFVSFATTTGVMIVPNEVELNIININWELGACNLIEDDVLIVDRDDVSEMSKLY
jgi:hypothetical protein